MRLLSNALKGWSTALSKWGWILPLIALLLALTAAPIIDPLVNLVYSPAEVKCPSTWTETTGRDPDGNISLKVCTSPEQRYIITIRQGQAPVGLDTETGRFLSPADIEWFLQ